MDIEVIDRWDDLPFGDTSYMELLLNGKECVFIKWWGNGTPYIMDCENGKEVYQKGFGADFGTRNLTNAERVEVLDFIKEQREVEEMMNECD